MRLSAIKNAVTSKVGRQILTTQKYSPQILFGAGVVSVVTSVVLASQATLKMSEILDESEENSTKIDKTLDIASEEAYSEDDAKKDRALNRVQTAIKVVRLYTPAFVVGAVGIGCLTGSHVILSRRNVGLTAAYAAIDKGFKEYRGRVVNELGVDKDREFRYGVEEKEIVEETEEGPVTKTVKVVNPTSAHSIYSKVFDEWNNNWKPVQMYNQMFIQSIQNYANDKLRAQGHLFLNEVYDMLGFDHSTEGAVVGWVIENPEGGDNYVDFGVFNDRLGGNLFVNGKENTVLLDFNVDGVIYDKIGRKSR